MLNRLYILIVGVFAVLGAWGIWKISLAGPFAVADAHSGMDSAAQSLLGITGFTSDLQKRMEGVPASKALVIITASESWTGPQLRNLAQIVLAPRETLLMTPSTRHALKEQPGAILFYDTPVPASLVPTAVPFGQYASLVRLPK